MRKHHKLFSVHIVHFVCFLTNLHVQLMYNVYNIIMHIEYVTTYKPKTAGSTVPIYSEMVRFI